MSNRIKNKHSLTLSDKEAEPVKQIMEETGLSFSASQGLLNRFTNEHYLVNSVLVYYQNGYRMEDGRYKDGIKQED